MIIRNFKKLSLFILAFILFSFSGIKISKADEGMWLPMLVDRLNMEDMQKMGLKLTAEEIYSINHSSLKDAIIQFGNGCTGEIISDQGLILTNHHCGYGRIQSHSTTENDYLTDGFWAYKKTQELPNEGLIVKFLVRMEDVTSKVLAEVTDKMSEEKRNEKISAAIKSITEEAVEGTIHEAVIKPFFGGNEYYMFVTKTYKDVRLVGAPPSSIGKFGGDTDNWMWPRHTGDFSMFRVYADKNGQPAEYSKNNVPLNTEYHLPISLKGIEKNDFAMILGYPGSTQRYLTSYGIEHNLKNVYPERIKIRRKKLDIIKEDMNASDKVRIQYSSKYARIANYWKNFIGMSKGLKKLKVAAKKRAEEKDVKSWISQYSSRQDKYGNALSDIEKAYETIDKFSSSRYYFIEAIYSGPEVLRFSLNFSALLNELNKEEPDLDAIKAMTESLKKEAENFYKDFNLSTDKKLWVAMMKMYKEGVPADQQPKMFKEETAKFDEMEDWEKMADKVYKKSIFSSKSQVLEFLNDPNSKTLEKDPALNYMEAFFSNYYINQDKAAEANNLLKRGSRLYIDALRKTYEDKAFYPDANFTMRLTYGKVLDYYPADAIHYDYYTTMEGIMEKEDPNNPEFIVPDGLKQIYKNKNYGPYSDGDHMKVCFLTDNDITGGNSGSPVINGNGELIGLAFDGNWEAMSGDILFEPELQRTINVDIRYVLLIIDKYAGAKNLINEMTLVYDSPNKQIGAEEVPKSDGKYKQIGAEGEEVPKAKQNMKKIGPDKEKTPVIQE